MEGGDYVEQSSVMHHIEVAGNFTLVCDHMLEWIKTAELKKE
jgi:hypothetical protein